jgi:hypothetical protein
VVEPPGAATIEPGLQIVAESVIAVSMPDLADLS